MKKVYCWSGVISKQSLLLSKIYEHPFHLVNYSSCPLSTSATIFVLFSESITGMHVWVQKRYVLNLRLFYFMFFWSFFYSSIFKIIYIESLWLFIDTKALLKIMFLSTFFIVFLGLRFAWSYYVIMLKVINYWGFNNSDSSDPDSSDPDSSDLDSSDLDSSDLDSSDLDSSDLDSSDPDSSDPDSSDPDSSDPDSSDPDSSDPDSSDPDSSDPDVWEFWDWDYQNKSHDIPWRFCFILRHRRYPVLKGWYPVPKGCPGNWRPRGYPWVDILCYLGLISFVIIGVIMWFSFVRVLAYVICWFYDLL